MLGWNRRGPMIALELSRYVAPGSLLTIAADTPELEDEVDALTLAGDNLQVEMRRHRHQPAAPTLEALDIPRYDHVLVLGYSRPAGGAADRHAHARDAAPPAQDRRDGGHGASASSAR